MYVECKMQGESWFMVGNGSSFGKAKNKQQPNPIQATWDASWGFEIS